MLGLSLLEGWSQYSLLPNVGGKDEDVVVVVVVFVFVGAVAVVVVVGCGSGAVVVENTVVDFVENVDIGLLLQELVFAAHANQKHYL